MDPWRLATKAQRRINALAGTALASCVLAWLAGFGSAPIKHVGASIETTRAAAIESTSAVSIVERSEPTVITSAAAPVPISRTAIRALRGRPGAGRSQARTAPLIRSADAASSGRCWPSLAQASKGRLPRTAGPRLGPRRPYSSAALILTGMAVSSSTPRPSRACSTTSVSAGWI